MKNEGSPWKRRLPEVDKMDERNVGVEISTMDEIPRYSERNSAN